MNKPTTNERGERTNCAFHSPRGCAALKVWYNPITGALCKGCPFYKAREQFIAEVKKYQRKGETNP